MQQLPYNQPTWPPGPPPRLLPHQRYWRWFRSRNIIVQLLLSLLVLSCLLCTCVLSVAASTVGTKPTSQTAIPTDTPQAILVATDTPTDTPVPTDTPSPTPSPTPAPTATPTPKPQPTQAPRPTPTPAPHCSGVNGNPWCYDFNPGKLIYVPPSGFCGYFACIPTFYAPDDPGDGYIIECTDSTYSQSGGERGACSSHGGELRPLYSH
jgi:hypothetical protein